jgi:hypothetical protein
MKDFLVHQTHPVEAVISVYGATMNTRDMKPVP